VIKQTVRLGQMSWLCQEEMLLKVLMLINSEEETVALERVLEQGRFTLVLEQIRKSDFLQASLQSQSWDVIIVDEQWLDFEDVGLLTSVEGDTPVILLGEHYDEERGAQLIRAGVYEYLGKNNLVRLLPVIERAVRERKKKSLFATKNKESLVSAITHELRSPIQVEQQLLILLHQGRFGTVNRGQHDLIEGLLDSKYKMEHLIENLICILSETDYEHDTYQFSVDINRLILEEIMLGFENLAKAKELRLTLDLDENLPLVCTDVLKIYLILRNLLLNAITYTKAGGCVVIKTRSNGEGILIFVEDTGIGIHPEDLDTLFVTMEPVKKRYRPGAGLGLFVTKRLLDEIGGSIGVQSELEKGSIFYITLPLINRVRSSINHRK
jgi:signal transduction histidine kinase